MDENRFAVVAKSLTGVPSRRGILRGFAAACFGLGVGRLPQLAEARRKPKRKPKQPKPPKPNAFGCLDVGAACKRAGQCCSGICRGRKGKRRCIAHDARGCPAGAALPRDSCEAKDVPCTTATGAPGSCATTTGNAGYCAGWGDCRPCTKDADCEALCGSRAACIQCPTEACGTGTSCVGPDKEVCPL